MYYLLVICFATVMGLSRQFGLIPVLVPAWYLLIGLATFLAYFRDKRAALKDEWRVSEGTLHFLSLVGGWPGATIAQQVFRHKTRKTEFRIVFWLTVFANLGALAWLHTAQGIAQLQFLLMQLQRLVTMEVNNPAVRRVLLQLLAY